MTKSNMNFKPIFKLVPAYQSYLWGGNRLEKEFNKFNDGKPIAESWELSTHENGLSRIEEMNISLKEYIANNPQCLGTHCPNGLPILVKFIDSLLDLSVQVHPDDSYAQSFENGQNGKSEMWYVVDACHEAKLIYGFYTDVTKQQLVSSIKEGTIDKYLQKVNVSKDDVFLIQPGLVHAIGKGCLIVEIQQNSDLTYRLYDYNRKDHQGNLRDLHIDKALDVAILKKSKAVNQPMRCLKYYPGYAKELLAKTAYFMVQRLLINSNELSLNTDETSFALLVCILGNGRLSSNDTCIEFKQGDSLFISANTHYTLSGNARFIYVTC